MPLKQSISSKIHVDEGIIYGEKTENIKEEAPEVALGAPEQVEEEERFEEDVRKKAEKRES